MIGIGLALLMRVIVLFGIVWIIGLTAPWIVAFGNALSSKDLLLLAGGVFLCSIKPPTASMMKSPATPKPPSKSLFRRGDEHDCADYFDRPRVLVRLGDDSGGDYRTDCGDYRGDDHCNGRYAGIFRNDRAVYFHASNPKNAGAVVFDDDWRVFGGGRCRISHAERLSLFRYGVRLGHRSAKYAGAAQAHQIIKRL